MGINDVNLWSKYTVVRKNLLYIKLNIYFAWNCERRKTRYCGDKTTVDIIKAAGRMSAGLYIVYFAIKCSQKKTEKHTHLHKHTMNYTKN